MQQAPDRAGAQNKRIEELVDLIGLEPTTIAEFVRARADWRAANAAASALSPTGLKIRQQAQPLHDYLIQDE